ncbi:aspartate aminotransferase family protein [Novosphingobium sp. KA1]|uniref:aspartate aminotransferase family protein n=1 Tax=Novosphingobium sp. (strain KA1) TaxID=164608 RepID=UPI001A90773F|nr:acetylornithine transaminase [Novosphingobium sp. KA1]
MPVTNSVLPVYNPAPMKLERGRGVWLFDEQEADWLDCVAGIATNALGHCHPRLVAALTEQAGKLWHVSNALAIPGQVALAERLTAASFADYAFFTNSGAESIEAAIKIARRYHAVGGEPQRIDVIGFAGSFHGRTYAGINASGSTALLDGFGPRLPGYLQLSLDDHAAFAEAVARPGTAAVIVEPVQGEGGARALLPEELLRLRELTRRHGVLLIHDEVQCGMGRTGRLFAHQWVEGAEPDIMALAKALGGGFPVGACLATAEAARGMVFGSHGSTFGGNPLAMAVAQAAFDEIAQPQLMAHVEAMSARLREGLEGLRQRHPGVIEAIRGKGLLVGVRLATPNKAFIVAAREHRLLLAGGGDNCVRLLPALVITAEEVDEVIRRFEATCRSVERAGADAALVAG